MGQTTLTRKVKSGLPTNEAPAVGCEQPGAFCSTVGVTFWYGPVVQKCKSLAITPVLFVNVLTVPVPGEAVGVAVRVDVGEGLAVQDKPQGLGVRVGEADTVALAGGVAVGGVAVGVPVGVQPEQGVAVGVAVVGVAVPQRLVMRAESE